MTKTESAQKTLQSLIIDAAEQLLECSGGAGARAAIPGTDKLILIGTPKFIAENVPSVESLIGTNGGDKLRGYLDRRAEVAEQADVLTPYASITGEKCYRAVEVDALVARLATPAPVTAAESPATRELQFPPIGVRATVDALIEKHLGPAPVTAAQAEPVATVIKKGAERQWMSERLGSLPDGMYSLYLAAPAATQAVRVPDIAAMVDRFLGWRLPQDFSPDCGISFDGRKDDEWNKNKQWPIGTNLLSADQARAMFEYVLAAAPAAPTAKEAGPGAHHLTPENIAATIRDLREIESGTPVVPVQDRDWRTWAGVLARVIEHLATPTTTATPAQAVPRTWTDKQREDARDALSAALGDAMDCKRTWSAWGVGTMSEGDFELLADNDERLDKLVGAVEAAILTDDFDRALADIDRADQRPAGDTQGEQQ
jgi:hypothetical protein